MIGAGKVTSQDFVKGYRQMEFVGRLSRSREEPIRVLDDI